MKPKDLKSGSKSNKLPNRVTLFVIISFFLSFRNVLGTKNLGDILSEREGIASMMQATLDEATDPWGVKVERVEV